MSFVAELSEVSQALSDRPARLPTSWESLSPLYVSMNGALAFESSLLVLPTASLARVPSVQEWNDPTGWRSFYDVPGDIVFFACDLFLGQFGISQDAVVRFEPESGELSQHSDGLEQWAHTILDDYDFETGFSVAHQWQTQNGPLESGMRLLPKRPFILGGEYSAENMTAWPMRDAMQQLAKLHTQVRSIPDGRSITITGWLV